MNDATTHCSPVTGRDFYNLSGPDLLAYCGSDASKWAEAFCRIKEAQGWGAMDIDEGLMICWFANAIEHSSHVRDVAQGAVPCGERMWCLACGTVTRDAICDCNGYGVGHEMYREPNFVNYADTMQEAAQEQAKLAGALEDALKEISELGDVRCDEAPSIARRALSLSSTACAAAAPDKCAECGYPRAEHSYNGACYGLCGKFVSSVPATARAAEAD